MAGAEHQFLRELAEVGRAVDGQVALGFLAFQQPPFRFLHALQDRRLPLAS